MTNIEINPKTVKFTAETQISLENNTVYGGNQWFVTVFGGNKRLQRNGNLYKNLRLTKSFSNKEDAIVYQSQLLDRYNATFAIPY